MYEGWGLPITESLCFGKVPLLSNCSSLPEAGGDFADYFDVGSEAEFVGKLERLIFDAEYRVSKERRIAAEFRPRSWSDIGMQLVGLVREWVQAPAADPLVRADWAGRDLWPIEAHPARYYALMDNQETQIWPGIASGEMFRQGDGWWWPEGWGCWTKHQVARLAFITRLRPGQGAVLFLGVRGLARSDCTATISVEGVGTRQVALRADEDKWLIFRASAEVVSRLRRGDHALFEILLSADRWVDFRDLSKGADHRVASIGVLGFMLCAEDDFASRLKFVESAALGDLASLLVNQVRSISSPAESR